MNSGQVFLLLSTGSGKLCVCVHERYRNENMRKKKNIEIEGVKSFLT